MFFLCPGLLHTASLCHVKRGLLGVIASAVLIARKMAMVVRMMVVMMLLIVVEVVVEVVSSNRSVVVRGWSHGVDTDRVNRRAVVGCAVVGGATVGIVCVGLFGGRGHGGACVSVDDVDDVGDGMAILGLDIVASRRVALGESSLLSFVNISVSVVLNALEKLPVLAVVRESAVRSGA